MSDEAKTSATPMWVRVAAAIAIVAFFVLFLMGVLGYYDGWLVASAVFLVAFGGVWAYKLGREPRAIDLIDD